MTRHRAIIVLLTFLAACKAPAAELPLLFRSRFLIVEGATSPRLAGDQRAWIQRREAFVREHTSRLGRLHPALPVRYRLDRDFEEAARSRGSIEVVDRCESSLCGVAHERFIEDWERADLGALFTPAVSPSPLREAYAVALLGRWQGEPPEAWASDLEAAGLAAPVAKLLREPEKFIVVPLLASLIRQIDRDHRLPFEKVIGRIATLAPKAELRWRASLRRRRRPRAASPADWKPLRGATFSIVNRIEKSTISNRSHEELERLRALGYDAIALLPFAFQRTANSRSLRWLGEQPRGETDLALRIPAGEAHRLGMAVFLKPQIWLRPPADATQIDPGPDGWKEWFLNYGRFLLHHALLARSIRAEWLAVGHELTRAQSRPEWPGLIAKVRQVYPGRILYSANHYLHDTVSFWDQLDAVGVSAYFPLSQNVKATDQDLREGAREWSAKLEALARRTGKRVILTEVGFPSTSAPWIEPWRENRQVAASPADQARAFEAVLGQVSGAPWFGGFFIWKYESDPDRRDPSGYLPKGKPAEEVIRKYLSP